MEQRSARRKTINKLGWLFIGVGLAVMALALGLLPLDDTNVTAPRWIVGIGGAIFATAGLMMLLGEQSPVNNLLAAFLLTGMGLIGGWVGLFGSDEGFSGGLPFLPETVNISLARGLFGMGALICFLLAAYAFKLQFEYKNRGDDESDHQV